MNNAEYVAAKKVGARYTLFGWFLEAVGAGGVASLMVASESDLYSFLFFCETITVCWFFVHLAARIRARSLFEEMRQHVADERRVLLQDVVLYPWSAWFHDTGVYMFIYVMVPVLLFFVKQ